MKYKTTIAFLALIAVPHFAFGEEEDTPVKFEALPAAVATTLKGAAGEAKLEKIVLGDEDGVPAYEAVWEAGGHKHEIAIAKDGSILGQEEIITLAETPVAVRTAMTTEAGDHKILEVEKVLEKGATTYEFTIQKGKAKEAVSFSEDGKILGRETPEAEKMEKKGKKDKDEAEEDDGDEEKSKK